MIRRPLRTQTLALIAFVLPVIWAADRTLAQDEPEDPLIEVFVIFVNGYSSPVNIYLIDDSQAEGEESTAELFVPELPVQKQFLQKAAAGAVFQIREALGRGKDGKFKDGKVLAEYVTGDERRQEVPLGELIDWQSPVEVVFQNTTTESLDFYWLQSDGTETLIAEQLQPQREFSAPSLPGFSWIIKRKDDANPFVAELMAGDIKQQVVDVAALASWFQGKTVAFENRTKEPLHIYWVDQQGDEVLYTKTDQEEPLPLPTESRMYVTALPLSEWRIRRERDNTLIAAYSVDNEPRQIVELSTSPTPITQ